MKLARSAAMPHFANHTAARPPGRAATNAPGVRVTVPAQHATTECPGSPRHHLPNDADAPAAVGITRPCGVLTVCCRLGAGEGSQRGASIDGLAAASASRAEPYGSPIHSSRCPVSGGGSRYPYNTPK
jgi:hypothetical protein